MRLIPLTKGQFAKVDDDDYDYLIQWKWYSKLDRNGGYYAARSSPVKNGKQKTIRMHRFLLDVNDSKLQIDHIDHDTLNNCRSNIRTATHSQNQSNRFSKNNSTSKYLGVSWSSLCNKWRSVIRKNKKDMHIGLFSNEIEAALAYDKKALELHGEFANLNFKNG